LARKVLNCFLEEEKILAFGTQEVRSGQAPGDTKAWGRGSKVHTHIDILRLVDYQAPNAPSSVSAIK
jgi:hypothetical protein